MKKNTIIVVVLAVLVLISVVQAVQLTSLKGKLASEDFAVKTTSQKTTTAVGKSTSSSGASLPTSLDDLETMVGGC